MTTKAELPDSGLPEELRERRRVLVGELKDRSLWFVRVRWGVPPIIIVGGAVARAASVELAVLPLLAVAVFVLAYNTVFLAWYRRFADLTARQAETQLRRFTRWQVGCDYLAMFVVLYFTGGPSSPFIFFLIFHIIFASILLKHRTARWTAVLVAAGVGLLFAADAAGWLPRRPLVYGGQPVGLADRALPLLLEWFLFAATVLISTFAICDIMEMVRRRIFRLADLSRDVIQLNARLASLNVIGRTIVSLHRLAPALEVICSELARVMVVQGASVKLLDEDGRRLRYASACGLPAGLTDGEGVEVAHSPLNRRILAGEPHVTGDVGEKGLFQMEEQLTAAGIRSVLFVPLRSEDGVIGILGAYCRKPARFKDDEIAFLVLAAEIATIAIGNARAYEAIESLSRQREQFMMRVAHNLRAPLAAIRSMVEVLLDGYIGELNEKQREYVGRVGHRARKLTDLTNELLVLAESQAEGRRPRREVIDVAELMTRVEHAFRDRAESKGLAFRVASGPGLRPLMGDADLVERLLENLVSNAVKYTPVGGEVDLIAVPDGESVLLTVRDTGIGIPADARPRLCSEFFRAENARAVEEIGTGLGLAIVKEIVHQAGGHLAVDSEVDCGTTFTVSLPWAGPPFPGRRHHDDNEEQPEIG